MTSMSKNMYSDKLDDIANKCNNIYKKKQLNWNFLM